jgi:hypothetical protein
VTSEVLEYFRYRVREMAMLRSYGDMDKGTAGGMHWEGDAVVRSNRTDARISKKVSIVETKAVGHSQCMEKSVDWMKSN